MIEPKEISIDLIVNHTAKSTCYILLECYE